MTLPLLVSVSHAGLTIPEELAAHCLLTPEEIADDGDRGARVIFAIESEVATFVTTDIARAAVDMNRARDDRRKDGIVKTHTCWDVPIYRQPLPESLVDTVLDRYHEPYHARLTAAAELGLTLAIDCHTMAEHGPPVGPDPGARRPLVCLSNADETCPDRWLEEMAECFRRAYHEDVAINEPFKGGFIIRAHAHEMPWLQIELSRTPVFPDDEKRRRVLAALTEWCREGA